MKRRRPNNMLNITITQKTYELIKADVTKLIQRYVTIEDDKQLDLKPIPKVCAATNQATTKLPAPITSLPIHPVVAPAPVVAPSFPIVQSSNDDLDVNGEAWDASIHSAAKTKTAQGAWRARRNLDKEAKTPAAVVAAAVAPVVAAPAPQPVVVPLAVVPQVVAPLPVAAPVRQMSSGFTLETFKANLVPVFADLMHQGKIDQAYVDTLTTYFKVDQIWQIMSDDKKVSELFENFCGAGLLTRIV